MNFPELVKRVGFQMAVRLQYEQLKQRADFWDSLAFGEWLDIYFCDDMPAEAKEMALSAIRGSATTFSDMERVVNRSGEKSALKDWAVAQMEQKASTFNEHLSVSIICGRCDLAQLLQLANNVEDLVAFCNCFYCGTPMSIQERDDYINAALAKMTLITDAECQAWISAYCLVRVEKAKQFLLLKIGAFDDLTITEWLSFQFGPSNPELAKLIFEKSLASARRCQDCLRIIGSRHGYGEQRQKALEKAISFATTMEELDLVANNNHQQPLAAKIAEKMAQIAKTFDDWKKVYLYSMPDNPLYQRAFEEMQKLAAA